MPWPASLGRSVGAHQRAPPARLAGVPAGPHRRDRESVGRDDGSLERSAWTREKWALTGVGDHPGFVDGPGVAEVGGRRPEPPAAGASTLGAAAATPPPTPATPIPTQLGSNTKGLRPPAGGHPPIRLDGDIVATDRADRSRFGSPIRPGDRDDRQPHAHGRPSPRAGATDLPPAPNRSATRPGRSAGGRRPPGFGPSNGLRWSPASWPGILGVGAPGTRSRISP